MAPAKRVRRICNSCRQPVDAMGTYMVSELLAQITNPERHPSHVVLGTELILRDSA
jgi:DNA-binding LacI/PurR family transcriptional regulator